MKKRGYISLVVGVLLLTMGMLPLIGVQDVFAQAATATLNPTKDNTLYSQGGSNGVGEFLFIGRVSNGDGGAMRRALLAFDVSSNVPAGATITGANLSLTMSKTRAGGEDVKLHKVLADWGEGTSNAPGQEGRGTAATTGDATWTNSSWAERRGKLRAAILRLPQAPQ